MIWKKLSGVIIVEMLQLKYFRHVARSENISHTAKAFYVPASSVSVAIKKLEGELGVRLFDRSANSLKLNECGRILLNAVDLCEGELNRARTEILKYSSLPSGEIRLLLLTNRSRVNSCIMEFKKKYPEVSFVIVHENCGGLSSYTDYDIIVSDSVINSDKFTKRLMLREELCVAVDKQNPLCSLNRVSLKRLCEEKFICMPEGTSLRDNFDKLFSRFERMPHIAVECSDTFYIVEYMKKGMGVTLFPKVSWELRYDGEFHLASIEDGVYRDTYIYTKKDATYECNMFSDSL